MVLGQSSQTSHFPHPYRGRMVDDWGGRNLTEGSKKSNCYCFPAFCLSLLLKKGGTWDHQVLRPPETELIHNWQHTPHYTPWIWCSKSFQITDSSARRAARPCFLQPARFVCSGDSRTDVASSPATCAGLLKWEGARWRPSLCSFPHCSNTKWINPPKDQTPSRSMSIRMMFWQWWKKRKRQFFVE